ncbi:MAG: HAD-IA family hydrolase [Lachnospiraceae bacterium]|jgi:putative hydrolase of the HAD superfamily|nr:HAD-IA family hydrolase [Lachnospiraceae bacterium]
MIKNIVFDMGKVLVDYVADAVCHHFITEEEERKEVCTSVFISPEWVLLDMGVISEEEALKRMQERLPSEHAKEMAALCFWHWHEYNMWKMEGMEELVLRLKEHGCGIYLCSNASVRLLTCFQQVIPGVECFDGILFSAAEQCLKPQKEIYNRLFQKFSLKPEECFFIDDQPLNIQGAKNCKMEGFVYRGNKRELEIKLNEVLESKIF